MKEAHTCLLIIDMINTFEFPGADAMFPGIIAMADRIAQLKQRAEDAGFPSFISTIILESGGMTSAL